MATVLEKTDRRDCWLSRQETRAGRAREVISDYLEGRRG